jgi:hypothetical protein
MSCSEFQEKLPELFAASEGSLDDPTLRSHLDTCEKCSALVRDLQYIAEQARQLLQPVEEEPSDDVWKKIQESIHSEPPRGSSFDLGPEPVFHNKTS